MCYSTWSGLNLFFPFIKVSKHTVVVVAGFLESLVTNTKPGTELGIYFLKKIPALKELVATLLSLFSKLRDL